MFYYHLFLFLLYSLYGICFGSFLNVVIYRLPRQLSIAKGRSMCTSCHHPLSGRDLVPIFSFLCLKRKCRYCGAPISWRYAAVESLTGLLFGLCGLSYDTSWYSVLLCVLVCVLITAWFIDLDQGYIPDRLHLILLALVIWSWFVGPTISLSSRLLGGLGIGGLMWLIAALTKGGIGGGDIKLMTCCGLLLGLPATVAAFFLAYVLAAVRVLPAYLKKQLPPHFAVPMAPYFAIAVLLFALYGQAILQWYFSLF